MGGLTIFLLLFSSSFFIFNRWIVSVCPCQWYMQTQFSSPPSPHFSLLRKHLLSFFEESGPFSAGPVPEEREWGHSWRWCYRLETTHTHTPGLFSIWLPVSQRQHLSSGQEESLSIVIPLLSMELPTFCLWWTIFVYSTLIQWQVFTSLEFILMVWSVELLCSLFCSPSCIAPGSWGEWNILIFPLMYLFHSYI